MKTWKVGDSATMDKAFNSEEVKRYADLVSDHNPLHLDANYAAGTLFKKPIVHGMLVAGLISGLLGEKLPGQGTIYLGQDLVFKRPVYIGEKIRVSIKIAEIKEGKPIATLLTQIFNDVGELVVDGKAVVKLPS